LALKGAEKHAKTPKNMQKNAKNANFSTAENAEFAEQTQRDSWNTKVE